MDFLNPLAIGLATLSAFLLGGVWYGPLFGSAWRLASGQSAEVLAARNLPRVFALAGLLALLAAVNLAAFLGPEAELAFGTAAGFAAGAGWVGTLLGIIYLFEARPLSLWLINAGYATVALTLMGAILGGVR